MPERLFFQFLNGTFRCHALFETLSWRLCSLELSSLPGTQTSCRNPLEYNIIHMQDLYLFKTEIYLASGSLLFQLLQQKQE